MRSPWNRVLLVLAVGLGTGIVTQILQSILPTGWSQVAHPLVITCRGAMTARYQPGCSVAKVSAP